MRHLKIITVLAALAAATPSAAQEELKRPIDYFDRVEITFTASDIRAIGDNAGKTEIPADEVTGKFIIFMPKVREGAQGYWETQMVRFASMSLKAGDYSWPITGVSASVEFIDDRPMRMVIGRRPGGRSAIRPGTQDFMISFAREGRSGNDFSLEYSDFAFGLFGKPGVEFVAGKGDATIRILDSNSKAEDKKKPPVNFGFTIGSFRPDEK